MYVYQQTGFTMKRTLLALALAASVGATAQNDDMRESAEQLGDALDRMKQAFEKWSEENQEAHYECFAPNGVVTARIWYTVCPP